MRLSRVGLGAAAAVIAAFLAWENFSGRFHRELARANEAASIAAVTQLAKKAGAAPADVYDAIKRRCPIFTFERCINAAIRSKAPWPFRWAALTAGGALALIALALGAAGYFLGAALARLIRPPSP